MVNAMRSSRSHRISRIPRARATRGFTLLEVLVALAIVVTALGASLRAAGSLSSNWDGMRLTTLANWSAENYLINLRLDGSWPPLGSNRSDCPQADAHLVCELLVQDTPNPSFRKVELSVYEAEAPTRRIVKLTQLVPDGL